MRDFLKALWKVFSVAMPTILGSVLLCAWVSSEIQSKNSLILLHLVVLIVSLLLIFFADALEVAYSLLRYKHQEQFSGAEGSVLAEMHKNESLIYEAREWLVTLLIVILTLVVEFPAIYLFKWRVPDFEIPKLFSIEAKTLFSVLFTTVPVLWFAQGLSKRIAKDCPQKMLGTGALVWALIKGIGKVTYFVGLDKPTELLTDLLKKSDSFSSELNLRPSDYNYYIASLLRYGYSIHDLYTEIIIDRNGGCKVTQRVLFYVVSPPGNVFVRKFSFDAPPTKDLPFVVNVKEVYGGPVIRESEASGKNNQLLRELDELAGTKNKDESSTAFFSRRACNISVFAEKESDDKPDARSYRIDTHGSIAPTGDAFAILVDFTSHWQKDAFRHSALENDFFYMKFDCPCFRYRLSIATETDCPVQLAEIATEALCSNEPHWGERERLKRSLTFDETHPTALTCNFSFPFPGTEYRFIWTLKENA